MKGMIIFSLALALTVAFAGTFTNAGEHGGVAQGEQYQSWRVDLDTPHGPISLKIDPGSEDNPYFGHPMTNRMLDKIVHDCGAAAGSDCAFDGVYAVTGPSVRAPDPFERIPTPDQLPNQGSYLWSDSFWVNAFGLDNAEE